MNTLSARLFVGFALWFCSVVHHALVIDVANTPAGMLAYHGAALMFDYATLVVSATLLTGRLGDDMQILCLMAMIVNFVGWILYLAYAPPVPYNYAIGVLGYVQWARLILGDHHVNRVGHHLVRRRDSVGPELHSKEAHQ